MKDFKVIENVPPVRKGTFYQNSIRFAFADPDDEEKIYCYIGLYPYGAGRYEVWLQHTEHFREAAKSLIKSWRMWFETMTKNGNMRFCVVAKNRKLVEMMGFSDDNPYMTIVEEGDGE